MLLKGNDIVHKWNENNINKKKKKTKQKEKNLKFENLLHYEDCICTSAKPQ